MQSISIDIDGVIAQPYVYSNKLVMLLNRVNNIYPRIRSYEDRMWFFSKIWHLKKRPIPHAIESLRLLHDNSYQIILNSSRPAILHSITDMWLNKYGIAQDIRNVYLRGRRTTSYESKASAIQEQQSKIHIDDDPYIVQYVAQMDCIDRVIFVNPNKHIPYSLLQNKKVICVPSLEHAVSTILNVSP